MIPEHARLEAYLRDLAQKPSHGVGCPCFDCVLAFGSALPTSIFRGRPFENYQDQPDTAERKRREVQAIPFALPEKRDAR
ncbi:MAG: hypothetical protein K0R61_3 [Microvirga sp.]|jgi:hypothetical protein|nr:hypothetical protein [Microvirga sp.]MDF2969553.1 hypothetical protein [Microvirga sp.]